MVNRAKSRFPGRQETPAARGSKAASRPIKPTARRVQSAECRRRSTVDAPIHLSSSGVNHWCLHEKFPSDCGNTRTRGVRSGVRDGASQLLDQPESVFMLGGTRKVSGSNSCGELPVLEFYSEAEHTEVVSSRDTPKRSNADSEASSPAGENASEAASSVKLLENLPSHSGTANATSRHLSCCGPSVGGSACACSTPVTRPSPVIAENCKQLCRDDETSYGQPESQGKMVSPGDIAACSTGDVERGETAYTEKKQRKLIARSPPWGRAFLSLAPLLFVSIWAFWFKECAHALTCNSRASGLQQNFPFTSSILSSPRLPPESRCRRNAVSQNVSPDSDPSLLPVILPSLAPSSPNSVTLRFLAGKQSPGRVSSLLYRKSFGASLSPSSSPTAVPSFCFLTPLATGRYPCVNVAPKVSLLGETPTRRYALGVSAFSFSPARVGARGVHASFWSGLGSGEPSTTSSSGLQGASPRRRSNGSDEAASRTQQEWVQELTAALQSGALKIPALTAEVTEAAGGRQITPRGLDDLIEAAAAVRAGLPLPSHLIPPAEDEGGEESPVDQNLQQTKGSRKAEDSRSSNEGKRSVAAYADEARRLQANLDGVDEERKEFFLNAYRKELRHRGVDDRDCQTPQDLCNRLAFARVFNSSKNGRGATKPGREPSGTKTVRAEVTDGGRSRRSRRSRSRLIARLSGDDEADDNDEDDSSSGIVQISPGVFMARSGSLGGGTGSPFDRLFADVFGGSFFGGRPDGQDDESSEEEGGSPLQRARGGSLLDHLFGGDLFSSLLGGGLIGGGLREDDDDEGSAKARVKKLDFKTPESAEARLQSGVADGSQEDATSSEETDTRLLQLLNKAHARGDPSLALFIKKSFQDPSLREMLLTAQTEGVEAAEAKADGRGKYVLQRLKDNQLFG